MLSSERNVDDYRLIRLGFVRVVQVFVPFGLAWGCLGLLAALIGFASRRAFVTSVLLSGLFTFLNCKCRFDCD